jgi:succinyl-CoA synthetase beta subunit
MKIHEYQGHELFREYGIPVSAGKVAATPGEAEAAAKAIGGKVVVKAQVLVGGRGKAGGVKVADTPTEARKAAEAILGLDIKGSTVEKVLVVKAEPPEREYYLGFTVDRSQKGITLMMSASGGVDIEELAVEEPEKIHRLPVFPAKGIDATKLEAMLDAVFGTDDLIEQARDTVHRLYRLFGEKDCSLVEINPYALVPGGKLVALDAKINFDDNALMKHPEVAAMQSREEYSADEIAAKEANLSFVSMSGDIGCIVNGAGLAMATMDIIKHFGGDPANFLDVGGSSNPKKVLDAFRIILNNPGVKAILINIFGGITRCDDIANGILLAKQGIEIPVPVVIRLIGTNDVEGREILNRAGLSALENLTDAVKRVVAVAGGKE